MRIAHDDHKEEKKEQEKDDGASLLAQGDPLSARTARLGAACLACTPQEVKSSADKR